MQNFGHAAEATNIALNSQGSAIEENSSYMEGLEAKTAQVRATFQELANNVIDSKLVKSILSLANAFLSLVNTPIGVFVTQVLLLTGALWGFITLMKAMSIVTVVIGQFKNFVALLGLVKDAITGVSTSAGLMSAALSAALPIVGLLSIAFIAITSAIDFFTTSLDEQKEKVESLKNEITELEEAMAPLEEKKELGAITEAEQTRLDLLEKELIIKQQLYDLEAQKEFEMEYGDSNEKGERLVELLNQAKESADAYYQEIKNLGPVTEENSSQVQNAIENYQYWIDSLTEMSSGLYDYYNGLVEAKEAGRQLSSSQEDFIEQFPEIIAGLEKYGIGVEEVNSAIQDLNDTTKIGLDDLKSFEENLENLTEVYGILTGAVDEYNTSGGFTLETLSKLLDLDYELLNDLELQNGQLVLNRGELYNRAIALKEQAKQELTAKTMNELHSIAMQDLAGSFDKAGEAASNNDDKFSGLNGTLRKLASGSIGAGAAINYLWSSLEPEGTGFQTFSEAAKAAMEETLNTYTVLMNQIDSAPIEFDTTPTSTSIKSDSTDPLKEQNEIFKERIEILEHELFLMEKQGASEEDRIKKLKEIQNVIHEQADWFRKQGVDENSEYIRELNKQWWGYQDDIEDLENQITENKRDAFDERLEISENYIEDRNDLDDWGSDNEIAAYQRVLDWMDQWYKNDLIDYEYYWEKRKAIAKKQAKAIEESLEKIQENRIENIENQIKDMESLFSVIAEQAQKEIDILESQKEAIEQKYQAQIDAIEEANDELERQIELEEAMDALARARQAKVMVYKDGRFQYVEDIDQVSEAQSNLDRLQREEQKRKDIEALEAQRDAEIKLIDESIKYWEDYVKKYGDYVDDFAEEQERKLLEQKYGIKLEGENWELSLKQFEDYIKEYKKLQEELTSLESMGNISSSGQDWSQIWLDADKAYKDGLISKEEADAIKDYAHSQKEQEMAGSGATFNPSSGKWQYASGTTSAYGGLSLVGENGPELRLLNKGDGILPSDITKNLWAWGMTTPTSMMNSIVGGLQSMGQQIGITIQNFSPNLPNVQDGQGFATYMRNNFWREAIQFAKT